MAVVILSLYCSFCLSCCLCPARHRKICIHLIYRTYTWRKSHCCATDANAAARRSLPANMPPCSLAKQGWPHLHTAFPACKPAVATGLSRTVEHQNQRIVHALSISQRPPSWVVETRWARNQSGNSPTKATPPPHACRPAENQRPDRRPSFD